MRLFILLLVAASTVSGARLVAQEAKARPAAGSADAKPDAATVEADDKPGELYLRVNKTDAGKPGALQTAIVRYQGVKGSTYENQIVDLVGVVHVGQREYYSELNDRLAKYDTVLYELVAPDGTRIRPEDLEDRRSLLASMQTGMKDMLNLEYQLELVDYMASNFRHADMSPEEFMQDLARRGDSIWKMVARAMGAGLASSASSGGDAAVLFALFSDDRSKKMKQMMARQLIDMEIVTAGIDDANGENTLIKGRNAKAFKILREELDAGKRKVSVFYGAGHLPDMANRLQSDFQMEAQQTTWLDAWDLTRN
jgi:hypothetical protein